MASPGPECRSAVVKDKLFNRAAFEPSDADLNLIGEQDEDVVMVDSHDELVKSKAKVADSDDEPISNLKGKGKGFKVHSLLKMCFQTLTDFHAGSIRERTVIALQYSRSNLTTHYNDGHRLNPGISDEVLEEYDWLPLNCLAEDSAFISWWNDFALLRDRFHGRVSIFVYLVKLMTLMPSDGLRLV